jgi:hypothetical protein
VIASPMLAAVFTVVFAVTGLHSLVRISGMASGAVPDGDRVAELSHLLMSIAMIAMTGAWSGGPDSASGILQIVVFGLIGLWFLVKVAGPDDGHDRVENGYHMVMAAAMVWMVAAMPVLMGGAGTSADGGDHAGHGSMAGMAGMAGPAGATGPGTAAGPPEWAGTVSVGLAVILAGAAAIWAARLFGVAAVGPAADGTSADGEPSGRGANAAPAAGGRGVAVAARVAPPGLVPMPGPRFGAGCHLLMSLGMAGMLLAML